jgi:hypothetical protein
MRPETKNIPDIGMVTLDRPNPTCVIQIGEPRCGFCVWTVSSKTQFVGDRSKNLLQLNGKKKKWSTIEAEAVKVPAESYAKMKADAINNCKIANACSKVKDWRLKVDTFDSIIRGDK